MSHTRGISSLVEDILLDIEGLTLLSDQAISSASNPASLTKELRDQLITFIQEKQLSISDLADSKNLRAILKANNITVFSEEQIDSIVLYFKHLHRLDEKIKVFYVSFYKAYLEENKKNATAEELAEIGMFVLKEMDFCFDEERKKLISDNITSIFPICQGSERDFYFYQFSGNVASWLKYDEFIKIGQTREYTKPIVDKLYSEDFSDFSSDNTIFFIDIKKLCENYKKNIAIEIAQLVEFKNSNLYQKYSSKDTVEFLSDLLSACDRNKRSYNKETAFAFEKISKNSSKLRALVEKYKAMIELEQGLSLHKKSAEDYYFTPVEARKHFESEFERHKTIFKKSEDGPVKRFFKELAAIFVGKRILKTKGDKLIRNVSSLFSKPKDKNSADEKNSLSVEDAGSPKAGRK